jgi:hypothetical protein
MKQKPKPRKVTKKRKLHEISDTFKNFMAKQPSDSQGEDLRNVVMEGKPPSKQFKPN